MKLSRVRITEYRSIWDSNEFETGQVTCLVGKNEAGKTSILQALYRLNPIVDGDGEFDVTDDYPRSEVEDYTQAVESEKRKPAKVVTATFVLDADEVAAIEKEVGPAALKAPEVEISKGYAKVNGRCTRQFTVPVVQSAVVKNLLESYGLREGERKSAAAATTLAQLAAHLAKSATQQEQAATSARAEAEKLEDAAEKAAAMENAKTLGESEQAKALRERVAVLQKHKDLGLYLWHEILSRSFPKFLYFDDYYQMLGHDNVEALKARQRENQLKKSDHPLLGLIELARLNLDQLLNPTRTGARKSKRPRGSSGRVDVTGSYPKFTPDVRGRGRRSFDLSSERSTALSPSRGLPASISSVQ